MLYFLVEVTLIVEGTCCWGWAERDGWGLGGGGWGLGGGVLCIYTCNYVVGQPCAYMYIYIWWCGVLGYHVPLFDLYRCMVV